ncbi:stellacyanin-like [Carica papaya]|uniref:stellacyanin-like n=1 Tax=Carica papaya TaxID=3649 RepID=UPI000B8CEFE8|nr:stellacyanin-like [Carica papaya]
MYYYSFLFIIILMMILLEPGKSEVYTVGDEEEWNSDVNYGSWSHKYNFTLGDILVFKYSKNEHNAYEVTEASYQSCDVSNGNGVLAKYESGEDEVELSKVKKYFFICIIAGHCFGGMRFAINVSNVTAVKIPESEPNPPSKSLSFTFAGCQNWNLLICLVASGILFKLY